ncbi:P-loop containing nucleoside triphosphate hydrolase protein [Choiromyces venosus 120613-1]|uniref:P-loop containing nucleoside triphosphate hydrolase protein n=1 Tax=Choiromyces venosus 120613-1 TaxID=1336337 RepID=A0A3N4JD89_9PEZI|nr:P-loop containing nucleoside triphosphate hydrolase protein [Choiromyces venosus 120613-1]RPA96225.1 P-loop containing nucleoside triphosphate hydrolase protein [Choiromyces venosus 120613-1]
MTLMDKFKPHHDSSSSSSDSESDGKPGFRKRVSTFRHRLSDKFPMHDPSESRASIESHRTTKSDLEPVPELTRPTQAELDMEAAKASTAAATPRPICKGMLNEVKTLDTRFNKRGEPRVTESTVSFTHAMVKPKPENFSEYCMVIKRRFNEEGKQMSSILEIYSPYLIKAFQEILGRNRIHYIENRIDMGDLMIIEGTPEVVYHYQKELSEYRPRSANELEDTQSQVELLLAYMRHSMGNELLETETFFGRGLIKYQWLWMIFRPGDLVYHPSTDELSYLCRTKYQQNGFCLVFESVVYDGKSFNRVQFSHTIHSFDTTRPISALSAIPLSLHKDPEGLREKLQLRGAWYFNLQGVKTVTHPKLGRVVVDTKTYNRRSTHKQPSATHISYGTRKCACVCDACEGSHQEKSGDSNHKLRELSNEDKLLCVSTIHGFVLSRKVWEKIRVEKLKPTCWQEDPMEEIAMDESVKKAIRNLLLSPLFFGGGVSTEMLGNKGKGFVVLLHGPTGTGKTVTVESIAEHLKRPLYVLAGGELGSTSEEVNKKLGDALDLAFRWKAITLIEEADIFLQPRSREDIFRNNLASSFHRNLEYFQGVLFITTNRLERGTVDKALFSRAHVVIKYNYLGPDGRRKVWQNSVREFPAEEVDMSNEDYDNLAKHNIDGRRISSITRIAMMLAKAAGGALAMRHFDAALVTSGAEICGKYIST